MVFAFIFGIFATGCSLLLSMVAKNWQVAFALSLTITGVSITITNMLRYIPMFIDRRAKKKNTEDTKVLEESEKWAKAISVFYFPSLITTVILYFKLYR